MFTLSNAFFPYIGGPGLSVAIDGGVVINNGGSTVVPAQVVSLAANTTTYVFLNTSSIVIQSNTSGFPSSNCYPIATVLTSNSVVTSITDMRPDIQGGGSGGGGSTVNVNGSPVLNPNFNGTTPSAPGGDTNVTWQVDGSGNVSAYVPASSSGTVTSVGLATGSGSSDALYTISGSPVTSSGTLTETLNTQNANLFFAGPSSGGAATPTWRAIAAADIPSGTVLWNNLGNANGALTLANGGNSTTFDQTSAVAWTWGISSSVGAITSSPVLAMAGLYQSGASTFAADTWSAEVVVGSGTNGTSTLTWTHSGSTGALAYALPAGSSLKMLGSTSGTMTQSVGAAGNTVTWNTNGTNTASFRAGSNVGCSLGIWGWTSSVDSTATIDTGLSRDSAGVVDVGNGSQGDQSGTLNATIINALTGYRVSGAATSGNYLRGNGTNFVSSAIQSGDVTWDEIGSAANNLTLSNAGFSTTFNQTSQVNWTWANTTAATSLVNVSSPILTLNGSYWTGSASATDSWTITSHVNNGTNGSSYLVFAHTGTGGNAALQVPSGALGGGSASWGVGFNTSVGFASSGSTIGIQGSSSNTILAGYNSANAQSWTITAGAPNAKIATVPTNGTWAISGSVTTVQTAAVTLGNKSNMTLTSANQIGVSVGNGSGTATDGTLVWQPASGTGGFTALLVSPYLNTAGTGLYTGILLQAVEASTQTSSLTAGNKFLDLQGGAAGTTSRFTIANTGTISNYNTVATVRNGTSANYASADLTSQTAAIGATTLYAAASTGVYRINWSAAVTTASDGSSVLGGSTGFQVTYTSPTDSVVKTTVAGNSVTSAANTTGTATSGSLIVYAKTGTNISYSFGYSSTFTTTTMAYELHITLEAL